MIRRRCARRSRSCLDDDLELIDAIEGCDHGFGRDRAIYTDPRSLALADGHCQRNAAVAAALRHVHAMFGARPQPTRVLENPATQSAVLIFTIVAIATYCPALIAPLFPSRYQS